MGKAAATGPAHGIGIEARIAAAGDDADALLRTLDIEIALRRAGRCAHGNGRVHARRALCAAMLLVLLLAALGAFAYARNQSAAHGYPHRPDAAPFTASPARDPSTPADRPGRRSAPPTR